MRRTRCYGIHLRSFCTHGVRDTRLARPVGGLPRPDSGDGSDKISVPDEEPTEASGMQHPYKEAAKGSPSLESGDARLVMRPH